MYVSVSKTIVILSFSQCDSFLSLLHKSTACCGSTYQAMFILSYCAYCQENSILYKKTHYFKLLRVVTKLLFYGWSVNTVALHL